MQMFTDIHAMLTKQGGVGTTGNRFDNDILKLLSEVFEGCDIIADERLGNGGAQC